MLHFLDEFLDLLGHFRIVAHRLAKLIQIAQAIVIGALRRNRGIVGLNWRSSAGRVISGIEIAVYGAIATGARVSVAIWAAVIAATESCAWPTVWIPAALIRPAILLAAALPLSLSLTALLSLALLASLAVARL